MIKKITTFLIILTILIGFYFLTSKKPASIVSTVNPTSDYILFYGDTCPHCKIVEEFISTNQIDQKLKISQLEVYENKPNSTLFINTVQEICPDQLSNNGLPVPFLVDQKDKKCITGDSSIIQYFTEKSK
ncbi:MAG: hypothetical protein PHN66_02660 [Candidatus Shapirobacteria bacterium]|nr:hypothetical protein [Candidatus Shapirobacteria bacterium]